MNYIKILENCNYFGICVSQHESTAIGNPLVWNLRLKKIVHF